MGLRPGNRATQEASPKTWHATTTSPSLVAAMRTFESAMGIGEYEPASIVAIAAVASLALGAGTAAYQLSQSGAPDMPELPAEALSTFGATPPPPPPTPPAPAAPPPASPAANLDAQRAAADEVEAQRRRQSRQSTILTSPIGAPAGGVLLGA